MASRSFFIVHPIPLGVPSDLVPLLPWWLIVGTILGLAIGLVIAGVFALGSRLFPDEDRTKSKSRPGATTDGESRKGVEIRHYLRAIGEEVVEGYELDGQRVAFYLPERDVAITFDARVYFNLNIEDTDTYAVLVEHEMPGTHLGRRLPFETPDLTLEAGEDEDTTAAFGVLGLPTDASEEEIRSAYREKVKHVHPDQGGDRESFQQVRDAYTTARAHANDRGDAETASATS